MNNNHSTTTSTVPIATRRQFLERAGMGMGLLTLASMLGEQAAAAERVADPFAAKQPHFPAKAKHVIFIFAGGGPSQIDTWDPKPALAKFDGLPLPGLRGRADRAVPAVAYASPFKFQKKGRSGIEVSEVFPKLGEHVDKMVVLRSLWTDIPDHPTATRFLTTGSLQVPKPSVGSWVVYGLGYVNKNLPAFIQVGGANAISGNEGRQALFLPSVTQGVAVDYMPGKPLHDILLNIRSQFTPLEVQRTQIELARRLNNLHSRELQPDPQLEARIESFEMAFTMQTEATEAFDISKEPKAVRDLYGSPTSSVGARMLVARRLVERGVRFVTVTTGGWDNHRDLEKDLRARAADVDGPAAALLTDLERMSLLDETLVIWCGEFGRTVLRDQNGLGGTAGRDHHARAACGWMAGGGVKGGMVYGATDEFGSEAVENPVHTHDLHATILALLGFDHEKLTYRFNGREFRLTDNFGKVIHDIIA